MADKGTPTGEEAMSTQGEAMSSQGEAMSAQSFELLLGMVKVEKSKKGRVDMIIIIFVHPHYHEKCNEIH